MKPLIGITPEAINVDRPDGRGSFCGVSYSQAIEMAGGLPVVIPLSEKISFLDSLLQHFDGLLLSGGGDMDADFYAPKMPRGKRDQIHNADKVRDFMELHVFRHAVDNGLPVLGICRGIQVMNVALGGTLLTDIPNHRNPQPDALAHRIKWVKRNRLWKALQGSNLVNTSHHQAVGRLAAGLEVVAKAPDGIIEAVELRNADFVCGVQFHPERLVHVDPAFVKIFEVFVNHAKAR